MGNYSRPDPAAQTALAAANNCKDCEHVELVQRIVEAGGAWPDGQARELERVVRLLRVSLIYKRGSA